MKLYIGEQLKALRKEKQITQEALAASLLKMTTEILNFFLLLS